MKTLYQKGGNGIKPRKTPHFDGIGGLHALSGASSKGLRVGYLVDFSCGIQQT
jgi:hypothetical protein